MPGIPLAGRTNSPPSRWRARSWTSRSCSIARRADRWSPWRTAAAIARCRSRTARSIGNDIRCEYHGMVFDRSGRCVDIPNQKLIPAKARIRSFPDRGAGRSGLDLDGRSGEGQAGGDRCVSLPQDLALPLQERAAALQLSDGVGQSARSDARRLRAQVDAGERYRLLCARRNGDRADAGRREVHALDAQLYSARDLFQAR